MTANRYAVLVGSSTFPHDETLLDLDCPPHDVDGLNEVLSSEDYGAFTEIHVLKDRPHYEVLRRINQTLKRAEKDDLVLIYFSGHGKLDGAGRLHLATTDTEVADLESTSVPVQSIRNYVDVSPSTKTALILDCCYSGAVGEAFFRSGIDDQLNLASSGRGTFIMTASTAIQVAKEKEGERYGIFTKHLIDGIKDGAADRDGDGYVTMNELYAYVHDEVLKESHQEPMKWDLNVRGELVIARSGTAPWDKQRALIRARLLKLAEQGNLPDSILTKALEVARLKRDEITDDKRPYSELLARLTEEDLRMGDFIDDWLKAAPASREAPPERKAEQVRPAAGVRDTQRTQQATPQPRPATEPKRAQPAAATTSKPAPAAARPGKSREMALAVIVWLAVTLVLGTILGALGGPAAAVYMVAAVVGAIASGCVVWVRRGGRLQETATALLLWFAMTAILLGAAIFAMEGPDDPSPVILVSAIGMALGIGVLLRRGEQQTPSSLAIHWVGWSIQAGAFISTAIFDWAEDGIFWVALAFAAIPSGAFLLFWWKVLRTKMTE
jgi:hypothetical protein